MEQEMVAGKHGAGVCCSKADDIVMLFTYHKSDIQYLIYSYVLGITNIFKMLKCIKLRNKCLFGTNKYLVMIMKILIKQFLVRIYFIWFWKIMLQTISMHFGLVALYGDIDLGQHLLRQWLVVWWHQAITRTTLGFSLITLCGIRHFDKYRLICKDQCGYPLNVAFL